MVLTREMLQSGAFLEAFGDLPGQARWSLQRIDASLRATLARRPAGPLWLYAYGSLIWNPLFHYEARQGALLRGWQRHFCLQLLAGRASPQTPGRMLALDAGDACAGVVFRLAESTLLDELRLVWIREMVYGSYRPVWEPVRLDDGQDVQALVFVADPTQAQYAVDAGVEPTARLIAAAHGPLGSNLDYLLRLDASLIEHGIRDPYVHRLAAAVRELGTP